MMFNGLTDSQSERLFIVNEECAEVQQAISKILRHGYQSSHPETKDINKSNLERELGDLLAVIHILEQSFDVDPYTIHARKMEKLSRINQYLHHNQI